MRKLSAYIYGNRCRFVYDFLSGVTTDLEKRGRSALGCAAVFWRDLHEKAPFICSFGLRKRINRTFERLSSTGQRGRVGSACGLMPGCPHSYEIAGSNPEDNKKKRKNIRVTRG